MLKERVFKVISQVTGMSLETINEDSSPDNIPTWDSLIQMNLVVAIEEEFSVQFNDEQIVELLSAKLIILTLEEILE